MLIALEAQVLSLVAALSPSSIIISNNNNTQPPPESYDHAQHVQAMQAKDQALSHSNDRYSQVCEQLAWILLAASALAPSARINNNATTSVSSSSSQPHDDASNVIQVQITHQLSNTSTNLSSSPSNDAVYHQQNARQIYQRLQEHPATWVTFGQMAGFILKEALLRPPRLVTPSPTTQAASLPPASRVVVAATLLPPTVQQLQAILLQVLTTSRSTELRQVATSLVAGLAVSRRRIQPYLHLSQWPTLIPTLLPHIINHHHAETSSSSTTTSSSSSPTTQALAREGSLLVLQKLLEDGPQQIPTEDLDHIIPALIRVLLSMSTPPSAGSSSSSSSSSSLVSAATSLHLCLTSLATVPAILWVHGSDYLAALSNLAPQLDRWPVPVRTVWCQSLVAWLERGTVHLQPHLPSVGEFLLSCLTTKKFDPSSTSNLTLQQQQQQPDEVRREACEFWLAWCTQLMEEDTSETFSPGDPPRLYDTLRAFLPRLVPILLDNMVFSTEQQQACLWQLQQEWQEHVQQQQQGTGRDAVLPPVFHHSGRRSGRQPLSQQAEALAARRVDRAEADGQADGYLRDEGEDEEDDDHEDDDEMDDDRGGGGLDDDDEEDGHAWTVRKCAAATLDALSHVFGPSILLPCLLPALQQGLSQPDPWVQEACILALGAVAEGCFEEMSAHLGQIHPYLMSHLATSHPVTDAQGVHNPWPQVQCIAAWTLGRYAGWAVEQVQTGAQGHLLGHMTEVFLARLSDWNRRVQVSCLSAFGVVVESAGDLMAPYLEAIYTTMVTALSRYQGRSLLLLFDLFGILADCCGPSIAEGRLPSIYVPPLLHMWEALARRNPADRTLLPLMEGLASIAVTCGVNFQPYALQAFELAMATMEAVNLLLAAASNPSGQEAEEVELPSEEEVDPIICATDLLDGLVEGLGSNFPHLVANSTRYGPQFLTVLVRIVQHDIPGVRMSAWALVGDLARSMSLALIQPALPQLLEEAVHNNMDPIQPSVCANAVWAVGEICSKGGSNVAPILAPIALPLMQQLISLLAGNGSLDGRGRGSDIPGLPENAAGCVGRLALVHSGFVAPELPRFLLGWCDGLAKMSDPTERREAFQGFIQAVYANPQALHQASAHISETIGSILFAIVSWHIPSELTDPSTALFAADYNFRPFPATEEALGEALKRLVFDIKSAVGDETWQSVQKNLPVNVRRLFREMYQLSSQ